MTLELSPKLLDFIEFPSDSADVKRRGTIVDMIGEEALVEVSDDQGVPVAFVVRPVRDLAKVAEDAPRAAESTGRSEGETYFENGVLLVQNGLIDLAREDFRKAFLIDKKFRGTLLRLINNLGERRAFDAAIVLYKMLLDVSPDYSFARDNLAVTFLNRGVMQGKDGQLLAAMEDFNRALMLNPSGPMVSTILKNLVAAYTQLGLFESNARRYERAYRWFQLALELDPSNASRQNLAVALIALSTDRAARDAPKIVERIFEEPLLMGLSVSACWTAYGATIAGSGEEAEAKRAFVEALEADPDNSVARHNLNILSEHLSHQPLAFGLVSKETESVPFAVSA